MISLSVHAGRSEHRARFQSLPVVFWKEPKPAGSAGRIRQTASRLITPGICYISGKQPSKRLWKVSCRLSCEKHTCQSYVYSRTRPIQSIRSR